MHINSGLTDKLSAPVSLRGILRSDWRWWLCGAVFCFLLASVLMSGWPGGLIPNLRYPYIYAADGLSHSWLAERAIEGWIFNNPRSGYPFGSNFLDYPGADSGNLLVLKIFGQFTGNYYAALNLYFLTGFVATFVSAFCVMRALGLRPAFAVAGAMLFDFVPFHFQRLGHLFYTWYFTAPLFFYLALKIFEHAGIGPFPGARRRVGQIMLLAAGLLALGSFGVYYAAFGLILLAVVMIAAALTPGKRQAIGWAAIAASLLLAGVLLNLAPNIVHQVRAGANPEVAQRNPAESEIHGFKFVQLLLPRPDHRINDVGNLARTYGATFPMVHENFMASLGFIGATGFISVLMVMCAGLAGRKVDERLRMVALLTFVLFMFGTIGGFGSVFSQLISSSIRGWNRISIFVAFGSLLCFLILLQGLCQRFLNRPRHAVLASALATAVLAAGLYDQSAPACKDCNVQTRTAFELDRDFVGAIEKTLPAGSAVYQLPYMGFPEVMPQFRLQTYDLAAGFLQSRTLKWSYAGMKGRDGDAFYRALAQEPVEKQIDVIRRLGFSGVYIDRRGYEDKGAAIVARFTELLGAPPGIQRGDREVVFFRLGGSAAANLEGLSHTEIATRAAYMVDHLGHRYAATLAQGIDFKRQEFPIFVKDVAGMAGPEPWGRWSDALAAPAVRIDFAQALPQRFTLVLTARPFGPNTDRDVKVRIGAQVLSIKLREGEGVYRQAVDLGGEQASRIVLTPSKPTSPMELGWNGDTRKLGIGLIHLSIE